MRLHQTDDDVDDDDCDVAADDAAAVAVVAATVMVGSNHSLIDFIEIYEMLCWFGNFIKLLLLLWLLDWLIVDDGVLKTWNFKCVSLSLSEFHVSVSKSSRKLFSMCNMLFEGSSIVLQLCFVFLFVWLCLKYAIFRLFCLFGFVLFFSSIKLQKTQERKTHIKLENKMTFVWNFFLMILLLFRLFLIERK